MNLIEACNGEKRIAEEKAKFVKVVNEMPLPASGDNLLEFATAAWNAGFVTYHNVLHTALINGDIIIESEHHRIIAIPYE